MEIIIILTPLCYDFLGNLDERLPLNGTLGEFGLHEITVVSKNTKISNSVSTADIIALQQTDNVGRGKGYLDSSFKHSRSVSYLLVNWQSLNLLRHDMVVYTTKFR